MAFIPQTLWYIPYYVEFTKFSDVHYNIIPVVIVLGRHPRLSYQTSQVHFKEGHKNRMSWHQGLYRVFTLTSPLSHTASLLGEQATPSYVDQPTRGQMWVASQTGHQRSNETATKEFSRPFNSTVEMSALTRSEVAALRCLVTHDLCLLACRVATIGPN